MTKIGRISGKPAIHIHGRRIKNIPPATAEPAIAITRPAVGLRLTKSRPTSASARPCRPDPPSLRQALSTTVGVLSGVGLGLQAHSPITPDSESLDFEPQAPDPDRSEPLVGPIERLAPRQRPAQAPGSRARGMTLETRLEGRLDRSIRIVDHKALDPTRQERHACMTATNPGRDKSQLSASR